MGQRWAWGLSPHEGVSASIQGLSILDGNPCPLPQPSPARGMGDPHPTPCPARPSLREYSHVLGGQRPALHHADIQGADLGHGAQPQTFRAGGRPGSEAGPRARGVAEKGIYMSPAASLAPCPGVPAPPVRDAGSWAGGFRRRRKDRCPRRGRPPRVPRGLHR